MNKNNFMTNFAGKQLTIELNKTSKLANGSCWVRYGNTVVMAHVTMSDKPRENIDFFPLSIDYEEKMYAIGKIPGTYLKREGKPSDHCILISRCIDRAIRPFFPKDMRNDVCVVTTVLAADINFQPIACAMIAASVALFISDIPWNGPIIGLNVGFISGKIVLNPNLQERKNSTLNLTVAASSQKIVMIEAQAQEISEQQMLNAIEAAHLEIKKLIEFIEQNLTKFKKPKFDYCRHILPKEILSEIENSYFDEIKRALLNKNKIEREKNLNLISDKLKQKFENNNNIEIASNLIDECMAKIEKKIVRNLILKEHIRVDGRKLDEIRPINCEVNVLPVVHGSAIFSRGLTQTMSVVTLGSLLEEQKFDDIDEKTSKHYIHQYNFPSYSVGETKPNKGPGRREIGHGTLAEKALMAVIPSTEDFPYTIRVVSETLSSNGSTSQASICSSTLALMDAGVPIKTPVAGISCGLVTEDNEGKNFKTFLDIQGIEDFFGDMDFKVGGTKNGITAIQVDVKIDGLTIEIIKEVLEKTKKARIKIIEEFFYPVQSAPNQQIKDSAPKIISFKIPIDKIKIVIGTSGKTIQKISNNFNSKIDIQEDGTVLIMSNEKNKILEAKNYIKNIILPPQVGKTYLGTIKKILDYGAFVEIAPGQEGLIHISNFSNKKISSMKDVAKSGDIIKVKVIEIDNEGKINLSKKDID